MNKVDLQETKYISDIVTQEELKKWKEDTPVLINATTGSGKTYFIINILGEYCKKNNKKIILLTNRVILKTQLENSILEELSPYINITTYQKVSRTILYDNKNEVLKDYDYIVCDECHYFFSDSIFNYTTDVALQEILKLHSGVKIFLSATSFIFEKYINDLSKEYNFKNILVHRIEKPIYYNNLYYYKNNDNILAYIRQLPKNEKVLMFCRTVEEAYNNYLKFSNESAFICSDYNTKNMQEFSSKEVRREIEQTSKFSPRILFTTKALDNGVNIIDRNLKHIICDINDFDTVQQCIGRKRFQDSKDKINLYLCRLTKNKLYGQLNYNNYLLKIVDDYNTMSQKDFSLTYGRKSTRSIVYSYIDEAGQLKYCVNKTLEYKIKGDTADLRTMLSLKESKFPNIDILARRLKLPLEEFKSLEQNMDVETLDTYMSKLVGIKLFSQEKKELVDYLQKTAVCLVNKNKTLGIKTINGYFQDLKYPYYIEAYRENKRGENYARRYWLVSRRSEKEMKKHNTKTTKIES